jgi:uncharacterized Zn-finger protein
MQSKDKTAIEPRDDLEMHGGPGPSQVPVFSNPLGVRRIEIGVTSFDCIGLLPPDDHPHVYLNMGEHADIQCPYCSTRYRFNPALGWNETTPANCCAGRANRID